MEEKGRKYLRITVETYPYPVSTGPFLAEQDRQRWDAVPVPGVTLSLTDGVHLKRAAILLFHPEPDRFVTGAAIKIGSLENDSELRYHDEITGDLFAQADRTLDLLLAKYH